MQNIS